MKRRRRAAPEIRFYPNDPDASVGLVPATPVSGLDGEPPFTIEGRRYAPAPYEPGTLAFQYWQGETALRRRVVEKRVGRLVRPDDGDHESDQRD